MGEVVALTKGAIRSHGGGPTPGGQEGPSRIRLRDIPPGLAFIVQHRTGGVVEKCCRTLKDRPPTAGYLGTGPDHQAVAGLRVTQNRSWRLERLRDMTPIESKKIPA